MVVPAMGGHISRALAYQHIVASTPYASLRKEFEKSPGAGPRPRTSRWPFGAATMNPNVPPAVVEDPSLHDTISPLMSLREIVLVHTICECCWSSTCSHFGTSIVVSIITMVYLGSRLGLANWPTGRKVFMTISTAVGYPVASISSASVSIEKVAVVLRLWDLYLDPLMYENSWSVVGLYANVGQ